MEYRIEKREAFRVVGVSVPIEKDMEKNFQTLPALWERVARDGTLQRLLGMMDAQPAGILGVCDCPDGGQWRKAQRRKALHGDAGLPHRRGRDAVYRLKRPVKGRGRPAAGGCAFWSRGTEKTSPIRAGKERTAAGAECYHKTRKTQGGNGMEWVECLNRTITYMEDHLTEEIDYEALARLSTARRTPAFSRSAPPGCLRPGPCRRRS